MKQWTPMSLFDELSGTVIGQDEYLMSLCTTVWMHDARIQMAKRLSSLKDIPQKQNLLIVGRPALEKLWRFNLLRNFWDMMY